MLNPSTLFPSLPPDGMCLHHFLTRIWKVNRTWIGRRKSGDRLTKELPMGYDADDKEAGYDQVQG